MASPVWLGSGDACDPPLFDLAAARFAGAVARLNGRYCRGLQTLRTVAAPAEQEVEWVGVNLPTLPTPLRRTIWALMF